MNTCALPCFAACATALLLLLSPSTAAAPKSDSLTIEDALALSSHEHLLRAFGSRIEELNRILATVKDEPSARAAQPAAERCFMELGLLGLRVTMFPPPTDEQREALSPLSTRFDRARQQLARECNRINRLPAASKHLRGVIHPLHDQFSASAAARISSAMSALYTLRSQIELYKLQHNDRPPDFRRHGWNQLTNATDQNGNVSDRGEFGPYLQNVMVNPLNNSSQIAVSRTRINPATYQHKGDDAGFLVDESAGRVYVLDAKGRVVDDKNPEQAAVAD